MKELNSIEDVILSDMGIVEEKIVFDADFCIAREHAYCMLGFYFHRENNVGFELIVGKLVSECLDFIDWDVCMATEAGERNLCIGVAQDGGQDEGKFDAHI
ncbi:hypothetical protein FBEOM_7139 [Fusarium beomiforme]|uniref:Uncharacterized protein n=1 Tax=Fusarium beomiforme TaxID=44412 RepID=A0A9P5AII0_9HYPO|nr:hypothetical protein FBEOM_7139 [Fusarium beomiforme]